MSSNKPADITAEWTVHAQLTISRPADLKAAGGAGATNGSNSSKQQPPHGQSDSSTADPGATGNDKQQPAATPGKPVTIVYHWNTDDNDGGQRQAKFDNGCNAKPNVYYTHSEGDKSTGTDTGRVPSDTGCSAAINTTTVPLPYQCRSTCSIVLSACTDLYPNQNEPDKASGAYNTTATCTLSPETYSVHFDRPELIKGQAIHTVKDAFSQTSDQESKQHATNVDNRRRRSYNYRRCLTDSICSVDSLTTKSTSPARTSPTIITTFVEEGPPKSPSRQPSRSPIHIRHISPTPNRTRSSSPQPKAVRQTAAATPKKPPRTVHIDVYCTGSDADDSTSATPSPTSSSPSSDSSHRNVHFDEESNSTPQTVLESNFIHTRITDRAELPRRIAKQMLEKQQPKNVIISPANLRQFFIDNSTTRDEISESKEILFRKHMGNCDNTAAATHRHTGHPAKFNYSKNHHTANRDASEDGLSSNYPNSSQSTVRDRTSSSISSALASSSIIFNDMESWRDNETSGCGATTEADSVAPSDSFDYENATDRTRIRQMEQLWNQQTAKGWRSMGKERRLMLQHKRMLDFMHENEKQMLERTEDDDNNSDSSDSRMVTTAHIETDAVPQVRHVIYNNVSGVLPPQQCCRPCDTNVSYNCPAARVDETSTIRASPGKHKKILFTPSYSPSSQASSIVTNTTSTFDGKRWKRAQQFGDVVMPARGQNGRHFGPAKNPDCQCDHCRRWAAEREQGRSRTQSMGEVPYNRSIFWLRRQQQ